MNQTLRYRLNSVFFRTFVLVLLVCSLLTGSFFIYIISAENRNLKQHSETAARNRLRTDSMAMELTLSNLQLLMNQTLRDRDFTSAMITPAREDYARTSSIITRLTQIVQDYAAVSKAFLYIPTTDTVYTSDRACIPAVQAPDELLRNPDFLTEISGARLTASHDSLLIRHFGDRVYLCRHFYPDYIRSIGMLIFEIDLSQVKSGADTDPYAVYAQDGTPVFGPEDAPSEDLSSRISGSSLLPEGTLQGPDQTSWYYYVSGMTGWVYILPQGVSGPYRGGLQIAGAVAVSILLGLFFAFQASSRINRPVRSLLDEVSRMNPGEVEAKDEIDYLSQVYRTLGRRNRELQRTLETVAPVPPEQNTPRKAPQHIEKIRQYLEENYMDSSLSLEMAAEVAGISPSYLSRLFRQSMDISFVDYLNGIRVSRARELLLSTDLKVMEIASRTGFNSSQSFFRIFRKHTGMSPGDYRQQRN